MQFPQEMADKAKTELVNAFDCLNRATSKGGFWNHEQAAYACSLLGRDGEKGATAPDHRYTPFGLAGALSAYRISGVGDREKLESTANWLLAIPPRDIALDHLFYGFLWALAEAGITFDEPGFHRHACDLALSHQEKFLNRNNLHDGVGLYAMSLIAGHNSDIAEMVAAKSVFLCRVQDNRGIPITGDRRALYHQRLMYTCWGLLGSASITEDQSAINAARNIIQFVTGTRIDPDGGIRWHGLVESGLLPLGLPSVYPYGFNNYYECHQCFYLISLHLLSQFEDLSGYGNTAQDVFQWLYGANRWKIDLTDYGPRGVPVRCINRRGVISPVLNKFKGSYEVGSYLWAMAIISSSTADTK